MDADMGTFMRKLVNDGIALAITRNHSITQVRTCLLKVEGIMCGIANVTQRNVEYNVARLAPGPLTRGIPAGSHTQTPRSSLSFPSISGARSATLSRNHRWNAIKRVHEWRRRRIRKVRTCVPLGSSGILRTTSRNPQMSPTIRRSRRPRRLHRRWNVALRLPVLSTRCSSRQ